MARCWPICCSARLRCRWRGRISRPSCWGTWPWATTATWCCFAALLARIVLLPAWGRVVERVGAHRVLWLSAIGIIPLPAMWLLSRSFAVLIVAQLAAGAVWAAYELATLLLFFETIPSEKRVGVLTVFNLANAGAVVARLGPGRGGAGRFHASRGAYLALFAISALARAAALVTLVRVPRAATATPAAPAATAEPLPQPVLSQPRDGGATPLQGPHCAAARCRPPARSVPRTNPCRRCRGDGDLRPGKRKLTGLVPRLCQPWHLAGSQS